MMKNLFPGYCPRSKEYFDALWSDCTFVFDTNVLLDYYRYSKTVKELMMVVLEKVKDRVWIPNYVALEFLRNRYSTISSTLGPYDEIENKLDGCIKGVKSILDGFKHHPSIDKVRMMTVLESSLDVVKKELGDNKSRHPDFLKHDDFLEFIYEYFDGKVGSSYGEQELDKVIDVGEKRYKRNIPPGYMDKKKDKSSENSQDYPPKKYGDYIIWRQLIDYAKPSGNIIFITGDSKEDWYVSIKGKTTGPRPELIDEFMAETNHTIHIYTPEVFFQYAAEKFHIEVNDAALVEVKDIQETKGDASKNALNVAFYDLDNSINPGSTYYDYLKTILASKASSKLGDEYLSCFLDKYNDSYLARLLGSHHGMKTNNKAFSELMSYPYDLTKEFMSKISSFSFDTQASLVRLVRDYIEKGETQEEAELRVIAFVDSMKKE